METVALINHGCAKNLIDSELMSGLLIEAGFKITLDETKANIVIINTCSFICDAEKESVNSIIRMINENKKVIVAGCLSQKHKKELQSLLPEVKAFVGTSDFKQIADIVKKVSTQEDVQYLVSETPEYEYIENVERQQLTAGASSYIKISEGCNYACGYCIIPTLRGKYTSRKIENIVQEAKNLSQKGVKEIVLIAQDTTLYGIDLYGEPKLSDLLEELNKIEDIAWIRLLYTYPTGLTDKLLKTIAKLEKVVKYIDIPLQHSSKNVLQLMKRPCVDYEKLISKIRKTIKNVAIRTTFIVGYPGETPEDFDNLYDFIEKSKFDRLGVFEYSREKGTYSYSLPNQIKSTVRKQRKKALMSLQQRISREKNQQLIGKNIECIVECVSDDNIITARTYKDAPEIDGLIYIKSTETLAPGDLITVKVTRADEYDLYSST